MKKIICNRCGADITNAIKHHLVMTVNAADKANGKYDICTNCWDNDVEPVINGDEDDG